MPDGASGIVLFAHGSGSSRFSPRNRHVGGQIEQAGLGTLLVDLLTLEEEAIDERTGHLRFDIGLLAQRLVHISEWLAQEPRTRHLRIGHFGASTGPAPRSLPPRRGPTSWPRSSRAEVGRTSPRRRSLTSALRRSSSWAATIQWCST